MAGQVKLIHAALDEEEGGELILRGRLDPKSLDALLTDDYQREILPRATIMQIVEGFREGSIPDIDLGMRGHHVKELSGGTFVLVDPVFIIDGLQRVTAAKYLLLGAEEPRLGACVHFGTTKESERDRFKVLNVNRSKLSPNVLLRNLREEYDAVATLYSLSKDANDFVMKGRICWTQRQKREHFITALTFLKVTAMLHSYFGPGKSSSLYNLVPGVQKAMQRVGRNVLRENVRTYYAVIDECWGIRNVAFKEGASYLRTTFMLVLAKVFADHENFWRGNRLFVEADLARKLAAFPVADPTVRQLASAGGQAGRLLYDMILEHLNRGKRTKRLTRRQREAVAV